MAPRITVSRLLLGVSSLVLGVGACAGNYRLDTGNEGYGATRSVLRLRFHRHLVRHEFLAYRPQEWAASAFGPGGTLLVGSTARQFVALSHDGRLLWKLDTDGIISSTPWYSTHTKLVYFGCDDGRLYAVDVATGKLRWKYTTKGTIVHQPAYSNGVLIFSSSENRVYAVDATSGRWRWQYDRERPEGFTIQGYAGVLVHRGLAYTGFADGVLVAMKASTGEVVWTKSLAGDKRRFVDIDTTPVLSGDVLLTSSYASGLYALDPATGSVVWSFPQPGISSIVTSPLGPFIVAPRGGLIALDQRGRQRWRQAFPRGVPSRPLVVGPYVIVGGTESGLHVASARRGKLQQVFNPGYGISAAATYADDTVAVLSNRGHLYVFDLQL